MQELLFTFAKLVTAGNYLVLISTITLIASLSMQNAHFSERSRGVVDEMLYKLKDAEPDSERVSLQFPWTTKRKVY